MKLPRCHRHTDAQSAPGTPRSLTEASRKPSAGSLHLSPRAKRALWSKRYMIQEHSARLTRAVFSIMYLFRPQRRIILSQGCIILPQGCILLSQGCILCRRDVFSFHRDVFSSNRGAFSSHMQGCIIFHRGAYPTTRRYYPPAGVY